MFASRIVSMLLFKLKQQFPYKTIIVYITASLNSEKVDIIYIATFDIFIDKCLMFLKMKHLH